MSDLNEILMRPNAGAAVRKPLVIVNPAAGRRHHGRLALVLEALGSLGCAPEIVETTAPDDARAIAATRARGFDAVVVAGGDGTINEAINGLGPDAPPLGIIPLGTANVLAIEIGLPLDAQSIARTIAAGEERAVSTGQVNGRRFIQMGGIGFDARVVETVDLDLKRRIGKGAYVWQTFRELWRYPFPRFVVSINGEQTVCASVIVANGRHYGGAFVSAPEAGLGHQRLDVCMFTRPGVVNALRYAAALTTGRLARLPDVVIRQTTALSIEGPPDAPIQADGDLVGRGPARITLSPDPLRLLYPADPASGIA